MDTKISILFYGRKSKTTRDNLLPIYLRVTIGGERLEISTHRYVSPTRWSVEAGKVKVEQKGVGQGPVPDGHLPGRHGGCFRLHCLAQRPTHHFSIGQIQYHRQVQPAFPGSDIG